MTAAAARSVRPALALCVLAAACAAPLAGQRWKTQYEFDEAKSDIEIVDFQFPSPTHGIAVGLVNQGKREKPVALTTEDGGAHWQTIPLKENPLSVFFLNENVGWIPGEKNLWRTSDSGRTWVKLTNPGFPLSRVYFLTENDGWALCDVAGMPGDVKKPLAVQTHDGAQTWQPVVPANAPPDARFASYRAIAFADAKNGIILGSNNPPQAERGPDWLDPNAAIGRKETPHISLNMQTLDGGKTWTEHGASMFGEITRARFNPPARGLGLVEHLPSFAYPSEVFAIEWPTGGNNVVYRDKNFFVSDVWVAPDGAYYLAGIALTSRLRDVIPQKVKVLVSRDLKEWKTMEVDYRAAAQRVMMAGAGKDLWLATNNGMILKLVP
jgi:hypothetical protein